MDGRARLRDDPRMPPVLEAPVARWSELTNAWGDRLGEHLNRDLARRVQPTVARLRALDRNVVGFGFGPKRQAGRVGDTTAVIVFVVSKRRPAFLPPHALVPEQIAGIATDVREVGRLTSKQATLQPRPVPWGSGIEVSDAVPSDVGTLGAMVREADGTRCILSNAHVLAPPGVSVGTGVYQGIPDMAAYKIAEVARWSALVPTTDADADVEPPPERWNYLDAAIAREAPGADLSTLVQSDPPAPDRVRWWRSTTSLRAGMSLRYYGFPREGAARDGELIALAARAWVHVALVGDVYFVDQLVMDGAPIGGDSGSLAYAPDPGADWAHSAAVGLVFAGSTKVLGSTAGPISDPVTLLNPIETVLSGMGVTLGERWIPPPFRGLEFRPRKRILPRAWRTILQGINAVGAPVR